MLEAIDIVKSYRAGVQAAPVLRGVNLRIEEGEFVAVTGRSGSGKSTMLNVLSTLTEPDSGQVLFQGADLAAMREQERDRLRNNAFAMIFQAHHLMPYLSVLENVLLPGANGFRGISAQQRQRAVSCLERVGLEHKQNSLPSELSGGEQQRVAIARGLASGPRMLFADEPTGSLDMTTGDAIMQLLRELNGEGLTIVMVTHNPDYAALAGRCVQMREGRVLPDGIPA
ncbi:ABC transporter ATP-binding protein [Desulfovibrio sp. 86]|uniref:ABC transporter related n=1 Tax=uncultured Desulfovibrio sp. TaxID=167968 RepID=A0A212L3I8_9BACT|nr:ABC transporter ATP-binding protein [Desulfovibrio sp. 86]SCM72142.1 ABC transporter related [uncultured Desulfovibrio sp.]VZH33325.1 ABC transporter related [Desulfovibrio sp. 86]